MSLNKETKPILASLYFIKGFRTNNRNKYNIFRVRGTKFTFRQINHFKNCSTFSQNQTESISLNGSVTHFTDLGSFETTYFCLKRRKKMSNFTTDF